MIASLGNFALWLSFAFAIFQYYCTRKKSSLNLISIAVIGLLAFSLLSFFILIYLHIVSDFSVLNVYQNSHTTKPLLYKISGVWGNHEGSMLLWILVLTVFNFFIFKLYNSKNFTFVSKALELQAFVSCFSYTFCHFWKMLEKHFFLRIVNSDLGTILVYNRLFF